MTQRKVLLSTALKVASSTPAGNKRAAMGRLCYYEGFPTLITYIFICDCTSEWQSCHEIQRHIHCMAIIQYLEHFSAI